VERVSAALTIACGIADRADAGTDGLSVKLRLLTLSGLCLWAVAKFLSSNTPDFLTEL